MSKETNPHDKASEFYLIEIPIFFLAGLGYLLWAVISFPFTLAIAVGGAWEDQQNYVEHKTKKAK